MQPTNKITQQQFDDIQRAILAAANATTKKNAKIPLEKAKYIHSQLRHQLSDYVDEKLTAAINCAEDAAGNVKGKARLLENVDHYLYLFKLKVTFE
ncbi:hypothetical protein EFJ13_12570 [Salmonella enterica]|uniref:Uncharacterized protein n=1 Tax=Salmonella enterica subsp. enterica serovar Saintpaul TaxID=90105 RepID=A0A5W5JMP3_SALET|nr:hypothetical protein [Salmonella enterica]EBX1943170.1 hypothetical protein [Salmonella enterica subsp. enterica serovar Saintpaul]EAT8462372.1 hypothetical protein [Salmonella enterica]EAW5279942.1 hypothetical protein [Salmonella enterica]EBN2770837.1 hypothetical protein [Salmonella enterica]